MSEGKLQARTSGKLIIMVRFSLLQNFPQKCRNVPENVCKDVTEKKCIIVYETKCETENDQRIIEK